MKILVLNCGSSSLKYQLIDMKDESVIAKGNYERIGEQSFLTHKVNGQKIRIEKPVKNHEEAISVVIEQLTNSEYGVIKDVNEIDAIGHRVTHGGETFKGSVIITDEVVKQIEQYKDLAPIHIPAAIVGINACKDLMPGKPMVGVFDTAFHQTIPAKAYTYSLPYEYYEKYKVRKYGFHGTSHFYVSRRIAELLNKPVESLKTVVCHLGQGASICAVDGGKSVDTSMGLTPVGGIPMCARSGDLDPSIVTYLMKKENLTVDQIDKILNKDSGVLGISGVSADFRDIEEEAFEKGNKRALLAIESYAYKVAQFIVSYSVAMQGIDVIVFTAGIGENQYRTRKAICDNLKFFGAEMDEEKNFEFRDEGEISKDGSKIKIYVVPTNEELVIARDTARLVSNK